MDEYVNLSLEKYNELYDKAKKFDEIFNNEQAATVEEEKETSKYKFEVGDLDYKYNKPKFKKGDRVECINRFENDPVNIGDKGTVIDDNSSVPNIQWDKGIVWAMIDVELKKLESEEK